MYQPAESYAHQLSAIETADEIAEARAAELLDDDDFLLDSFGDLPESAQVDAIRIAMAQPRIKQLLATLADKQVKTL